MFWQYIRIVHIMKLFGYKTVNPFFLFFIEFIMDESIHFIPVGWIYKHIYIVEYRLKFPFLFEQHSHGLIRQIKSAFDDQSSYGEYMLMIQLCTMYIFNDILNQFFCSVSDIKLVQSILQLK